MTYIQPQWSAPKNVRAYVTTRVNGFSHASFSSFNLAAHVGDDEMAVLKNRRKLRDDLSLPNEPCWLNQQHTTNVIEVTSPEIINNFATPADAAFTCMPNHICVALTADCLPLLLCDKRGTLVAAIHAGWRGLADGIVETTLREIAAKTGVSAGELLIWLGPAIGVHAFAVGEEVFCAFTESGDKMCDKMSVATFVRVAVDKWLANIYALAKIRLMRCGVLPENIFGGDFCTFHNSELFFSYRRDGGITGRMASLIWLESS